MIKKVNIHEAKTHLSEHLNKLKPGDKLIICRRNIAIAEVTPIVTPTKEKKTKRPFGLAQASFEISSAFFEPLSEDVLKDFAS